MTVLPAVAGVLAATHVPVTGVRAVAAVEAGRLLAGGGQLRAGGSGVARGADTGRSLSSSPGEADPAILTSGLATTGGGGGGQAAGTFPVITCTTSC